MRAGRVADRRLLLLVPRSVPVVDAHVGPERLTAADVAPPPAVARRHPRVVTELEPSPQPRLHLGRAAADAELELVVAVPGDRARAPATGTSTSRTPGFHHIGTALLRSISLVLSPAAAAGRLGACEVELSAWLSDRRAAQGGAGSPAPKVTGSYSPSNDWLGLGLRCGLGLRRRLGLRCKVELRWWNTVGIGRSICRRSRRCASYSGSRGERRLTRPRRGAACGRCGAQDRCQEPRGETSGHPATVVGTALSSASDRLLLLSKLVDTARRTRTGGSGLGVEQRPLDLIGPDGELSASLIGPEGRCRTWLLCRVSLRRCC